MLDIRVLREDLDGVKKALAKRNEEFPLDEIMELDTEVRRLITESDELKREQNLRSKEIPKLKKENKDTEEIFKELRELSNSIDEYNKEIKEINDKIKEMLLEIPNTPNEEVVEGLTDEDNIEVRRWGEATKFDFEPKAHWDLGTDLGILDFERAAKITGSRFTLFKDKGARLERALISFMLDHNTEAGHTELLTPFIANGNSMTGTGQLPKFAIDMYKLEGLDQYLIPTAEVTLTNYYKDEIINGEELPIYITGYSPCFRREAGSAGRDTRGMIRNHQFDKVELVKFVHPDNSYEELEKLTNTAEDILQKLEIPYRVVMLCSGDLGFASAKTYDIEVWMPSYNDYVEISSCSNFESFQARRSNIRFTDTETKKVQHVHTLNGSGLAVGRTFAALIENYQNEDGSITIPEILRGYMGGLEKID